MKKRTSILKYLMMGISCLILTMGIGTFTACAGNNTAGKTVVSQVEEGDTEGDASYTMTVESVEPDSVALTIVNNTDEEVLYGTDYFLKRYENNEWLNIDTLMLGFRFNRGFYSIPAHSKVSLDFNWEGLYSPLSDGEYAISKTVLRPESDGNYTQVTLYAEFVLNTQ